MSLASVKITTPSHGLGAFRPAHQSRTSSTLLLCRPKITPSHATWGLTDIVEPALKSNKWYIEEIEEFPHHFYGVKFYYKGVAHSSNRYSLLTHDYEPRTIIMSCINIMSKYYNIDALASFGFVAAPDMSVQNVITAPNKRFRFYRRMMLTLFSPNLFVQYTDVKNSIYMLINKKILDKISISMIEHELSTMFLGDYQLS